VRPQRAQARARGSNSLIGTISRITQAGTVSTFATGLEQPFFLVAVPEPAAVSILAGAAFGMNLLRRRRAHLRRFASPVNARAGARV
jgi:hypothetical protein